VPNEVNTLSYTASQAQAGLGVLFQINTGTVGSPTWTVIGEINDFSQSGRTNKTVSTTNLQSPAEEWLAVLQSSANYALTYNRVSADTGQAAVVTAFANKTLPMFKISLPKTGAQATTGDAYAFTALVESLDDLSSAKPDGVITTKATLKTSGAITFTAGA